MKLAVIIPIYKNDNLIFIQKSIKSILAQTFKDFILYIAVDGPILKEVSDYLHSLKERNIEILNFDRNEGLAATLNKSIKYANKEAKHLFNLADEPLCRFTLLNLDENENIINTGIRWFGGFRCLGKTAQNEDDDRDPARNCDSRQVRNPDRYFELIRRSTRRENRSESL